MSLPLTLGLLVLLAVLGLRWRRREAALRQELDALTERLHELGARMEADEQDLADALSSSGVAEQLLLEKGIADEDEMEAVRRRLDAEGGPREGDDALH
ncbi:MAG: hypothetical protein IPO09_14195 [Anaeromyxobacter sp.]|nr:hypothetical protein [Anaeromyxobacter sp.]MBL0275338.1 hypothetical protein [Anaeromyxobacter sp.]